MHFILCDVGYRMWRAMRFRNLVHFVFKVPSTVFCTVPEGDVLRSARTVTSPIPGPQWNWKFNFKDKKIQTNIFKLKSFCKRDENLSKFTVYFNSIMLVLKYSLSLEILLILTFNLADSGGNQDSLTIPAVSNNLVEIHLMHQISSSPDNWAKCPPTTPPQLEAERLTWCPICSRGRCPGWHRDWPRIPETDRNWSLDKQSLVSSQEEVLRNLTSTYSVQPSPGESDTSLQSKSFLWWEIFSSVIGEYLRHLRPSELSLGLGLVQSDPDVPSRVGQPEELPEVLLGVVSGQVAVHLLAVVLGLHPGHGVPGLEVGHGTVQAGQHPAGTITGDWPCLD